MVLVSSAPLLLDGRFEPESGVEDLVTHHRVEVGALVVLLDETSRSLLQRVIVGGRHGLKLHSYVPDRQCYGRIIQDPLVPPAGIPQERAHEEVVFAGRHPDHCSKGAISRPGLDAHFLGIGEGRYLRGVERHGAKLPWIVDRRSHTIGMSGLEVWIPHVIRHRSVDRSTFPPARRFITGANRAGRRTSPMHGLVEVDVTQPRRVLRDRGISFTAFVVGMVGRAVARHPEVHGYLDWRGRLVVHRYVDITTLVEVQTPQGPFPLAHLVRDADERDIADISREIRAVTDHPAGSKEGRRLESWAPTAGRIPGLPRLMYEAMRRSTRMRRISGTVVVSSIGMFAGGSGHAITAPSVQSLSVFVGGLARRPVADGESVVIRDVLDLTVSFDHNVVDGAPAARFVADLRSRLTSVGDVV